MTTLSVSKVRIPPQEFNLVAHGGKRIRIEKGKSHKTSVFLISEEDMEMLESIEEKYWEGRANDAFKKYITDGESVSWKNAKEKLGI